MRLRKFRLIALLSLSLLASGCKEVLYSGLTEVEANEMVAVLAASQIDAERVRDKDGVYQVLVSPDNIAISTVFLKEAGLPKPSFQSLGEVFSASGIIGTPFEQQARYIFAMNQELSRTITEIEGVESARVTVNVPLQDRYNRGQSISTASVTLHHEVGFDTASSVTKIKQIVSHSMSNLSYDNVSVVFFPAHSLTVESPESAVSAEKASVSSAAILNWAPAKSSLPLTWIALIAGCCAVLLIAASLVQLAFLRMRNVGAESKARADFTGRS